RETAATAARNQEIAARLKRLETMKKSLDWDNTTGVAREWWEAFEKQNADNPEVVQDLCEKLLKRKASITEFFLAYVYSDKDNVEENLKYLDEMRKQRDAKAKEEKQSKAKESK